MSQRQWNLLHTMIFENVCKLFKCSPRFSTIKSWSIQLMHCIINLPGSLWRAICPWIQIKYVPWVVKNILLDSTTELSLTGLPNELWQQLTTLDSGAILPKSKREKYVLCSFWSYAEQIHHSFCYESQLKSKAPLLFFIGT